MVTIVVCIVIFAILFSIPLIIIGRLSKTTGSRNYGLSKFVSRRPLTIQEQKAYWRIVEAAGTDKVVLSQVAFSSFLSTEGGTRKQNFAKFGTARQKVADFVVCNKDLSIHAIIELDDSTHDKAKDDIRDKMTEEAGLRTFRIEAKAIPSVNEIREAIK